VFNVLTRRPTTITNYRHLAVFLFEIQHGCSIVGIIERITMKKAIICHGVSQSFESVKKDSMPMGAKHWMGWLQQQYIVSGVSCQNPSFPNSWRPVRNYDDDVNVFSRLEIDTNTRLVGHSCGGGFLLKYLSQHPEIKVKHLVLVAPWLDPNHDLGNYFKEFELDKNLPKRIGHIDLFVSTDDMDWVIQSVNKIKEVYGDKITYHEFSDKGHFREANMGTKEFPELWEVCKTQI
jgi:predicted alpha/beta hydrolase family esterase